MPAPLRPLVFEPGIDSHEYVSRGPNGSLHLTRTGIEFAAKGRPTVHLALSGQQAVEPEGTDLQASFSNYYLGQDSAKWRTAVANYGKVRYRAVYPGIDLIFHGSERSFEYDFAVAAGADPSRIRMRFDGVKKLHLNAEGDLTAGEGGFTQHRPRIFQAGREIAGGFRILRGETVSFDIGPYDRTQALTIDPVITYVSYLGGNAEDVANSVTVDTAGNLYLAGYTLSSDFPLQGVFGQRPNQRQFAFVSKFAPVSAGKTQLIYTIFLGDQSPNFSMVSGVIVDGSGNLIVAGATSAPSFPTMNAFQPLLGGGLDCTNNGFLYPCLDGFLAKFGPDGRTLIFSTFYGGRFANYFNDVALDAAGGIYAVGAQENAATTDLRGTPDAFQTASTSGVVMMATRWDASGKLLYATYLGGNSGNGIANSVAVEKPGIIWIGGNTGSADMPMPLTNNGLQTKYTAFSKSGFLARLDMNQSGAAGLTYASYFNGTINNTSLVKLFLDPSGQVVFCGATVSDIPLTATRMQTAGGVPPTRMLDGNFVAGDGYIARINPRVAGIAALTYSTYVGGSDSDEATSCGLDPKGNLVVTGTTYSTDLFFTAGSPIPYKVDTGVSASNVFLIRIDPTRAGGRMDSILFGGTAADSAAAMAIDSKGFAYVAGKTLSQQFPVTQNAAQKAYGGDNPDFFGQACCGDAFVLQADLNGAQVAAGGLIQSSGDFQFAAPGSTLPVPIVVRIADASGNPLSLSGYPVSFTATNATVSPAQSFTDGTGVAGTNVRLTGGDATVVASIAAGYTSYTFHLKALSGTLPKSVAIVSGDKQDGAAGAALAQPLVVELRDAGNAPLPLAGLTVQFKATNASVPAVNVVTDASGRASTTVTLGTAAGTSSVQATVGSLAVVTATYSIASGGPAFTAAGVTSAATFLAGGVSPGLIVTLFGSGIGPAAIAVNAPGADGKFPTALAGTQVLFDGIAAPMIYASAGQTSAIVPYGVATKTTTQVTVVYQTVTSAAQTVAVVPAQLGLFSANSSGQGPGAILNQDNSINSPANPAKRNSIVILFGTGEGQTTPGGIDGQTAVSVYPKPNTPITVKIGGSDGQVLYYGAAPTLVAGVLQINVTIPAGTPDGNATVQVFEGASQSPATITVAVKGDQ